MPALTVGISPSSGRSPALRPAPDVRRRSDGACAGWWARVWRWDGLGAQGGEIPAASAGMTDLFCAGMTELFCLGVAELFCLGVTDLFCVGTAELFCAGMTEV